MEGDSAGEYSGDEQELELEEGLGLELADELGVGVGVGNGRGEGGVGGGKDGGKYVPMVTMRRLGSATPLLPRRDVPHIAVE